MSASSLPLGELFQIEYGAALKSDARDASGEWEVFGSAGFVGRHSDALVKNPMIVVGRKGSVGKLTFAERGGWPIDTTFYMVPKKEREISLRYTFHMLSRISLGHLTITTSIPGLNRNDLAAVKIPVPPLDEQRRIAAILDKADAIRRKRQQALALADDFLRSAFLEMFGDFFTNPMGWLMMPLGQLITRGPQNGLYKPSTAYGSGIPIVRIDSFYNGNINRLSHLKRVRLSAGEANTYQLGQHDILINRVNSRTHLGKCALVPELQELTVFESNMMRLSVDDQRIHPAYLTRVLQTAFVNEQIQRRAKDAVNQASINQGDVTSFVIPLPPIRDQHKFVNLEAKLAASSENYQLGVQQANILFASLSQRAFRGEL